MNKTEFLQVISIQRSKLIDEHQKPGWNLWVLSGAFASLLWILISILEDNNFDLNTAIFISIFVYISHSVLAVLYNLISNPLSSQSNKYVFIRTEISNSLLSILFLLATLIFIYKFIINNVNNCPNLVMIIFYTSFVLIIIIVILVFIFSYFNVPINKNTSVMLIIN